MIVLNESAHTHFCVDMLSFRLGMSLRVEFLDQMVLCVSPFGDLPDYFTFPPVVHEGSDFSSWTLVIFCVFDPSHPGGCEVVTPELWFPFP